MIILATLYSKNAYGGGGHKIYSFGRGLSILNLNMQSVSVDTKKKIFKLYILTLYIHFGPPLSQIPYPERPKTKNLEVGKWL